jgi:hypothetical protein
MPGRGFPFVGLMLLGWAILVVVLAALTTWWVLFALIPVWMMSCMAMMGTMAGSAGGGPWAWCRPDAWFAPTNREGQQPTAQH